MPKGRSEHLTVVSWLTSTEWNREPATSGFALEGAASTHLNFLMQSRDEGLAYRTLLQLLPNDLRYRRPRFFFQL